jgi:cytochrome c biogenesis protein CcmG/thiol:disulfide interchange protein DsbE
MFGDTEKNAREFFDELGGDWPALVEETGRIAIDYGVTAVPETLLISPSGRVVQKWIGASGVTADGIDATIAQLEAGGS